MAKRSITDIHDRFNDLQSFWSGRNDTIAQMRDLYFMNHYPEAGGTGAVDIRNAAGTAVSIGSSSSVSSTGRASLDANGAYRVTSSEYTDFALNIRSMMMAQAPVIRCYADKETKTGDERSQNAEKVLLGVRYVNRIRQERDFMDDLVHDAIVCGWSCIYSYWDEEFEKTYKDDNWRDFPLVVKAMPPEHCYPKPGGRRGRWREIMYAYEREIGEVEEEFDVRLSKSRSKDSSKKEDDDKVLFYDDWWWEGDKVWHAIVAGEDWIKKPTDMSKWYKSLPYTISVGISTPSAEPDQMGMSLLSPMQPNVELQEDLTSRIMTGITYHADPTIIAEDGDGTPIQIEKGLGEVIHVRTGQKVGTLQGPTVSSDVYQMLQYVNSSVQRSGLPSISYGMGLSGLSGYAISLMGQGGQMKMVLPVANLEVAMSIVMDKCLDILRAFCEDKTIFVYGQDATSKMFQVKVKGNELNGFRVDVKLRPRIPQDEVARANRARMLMGVVSNRYVKENVLELQDPVADDYRQKVEQFLQNPLIMAAEMARAAAQWGVPAGDIQAFMSTMMPRQTLGPPQGPPGMGNSGPPPPPPGAQMAPQTPDELAMMQMQAAQAGQSPTPEGLAGMSMGGMQGGGY